LGSDDPVAVVVGMTGMTGMTGIGKSALVAQTLTAAGAAETYPDGIAVVGAGAVRDIAGLLRATLARFDAQHRLPREADLDVLAELARSLLGGRRTMVVLDDIPPQLAVHDVVGRLRGAGAAVVVTARHTPSGFLAATRLALGGLTPDDGVALLMQMSGTSLLPSGWREEDRAAAARIASSVVSHPLALSVIGAYIGDLQRDLQTVADELEDPARILDLPVGEDDVSPPVRSALMHSYDALPAEVQCAFAAVTVFGTGEFGRAASSSSPGAT
jgi:hypothetical protein